jgi:dihydroflavonol-4-reductase
MIGPAMTVVITGASGHIGANLAHALVAQGRRVRVLIRERRGMLEGLGVEMVRGDVRDPASLAEAFAGAEVVYHLAALISISGDQGGLVPAINVEGAGNVARVALECGVRRMIHFSSVHAFDQAPLDQALDETRARATSRRHPAYDRSKAAGEVEVRKAMARGLDCVILHPTGVIGPRDAEPSRMGEFFLALYRRALPALVRGGFDWVDVRDVAAAALAAEEKGRSGENYLISGQWRSMEELADLAEAITGVRRPRMVSPIWLARAGAPFQTAFNRARGKRPLYTGESLSALQANRAISHEKASRDLGHAPRPLEDTVRDIYEWFEQAGMLAPATGSRPSGR